MVSITLSDEAVQTLQNTPFPKIGDWMGQELIDVFGELCAWRTPEHPNQVELPLPITTIHELETFQAGFRHNTPVNELMQSILQPLYEELSLPSELPLDEEEFEEEIAGTPETVDVSEEELPLPINEEE